MEILNDSGGFFLIQILSKMLWDSLMDASRILGNSKGFFGILWDSSRY